MIRMKLHQLLNVCVKCIKLIRLSDKLYFVYINPEAKFQLNKLSQFHRLGLKLSWSPGMMHLMDFPHHEVHFCKNTCLLLLFSITCHTYIAAISTPVEGDITQGRNNNTLLEEVQL